MVQINKKFFEVYHLDTLQSIIERLAFTMKTLPKYLYFPNGPPTFKDFIEGDELQVENLLTLIKNPERDSFVDLYEKIKDKKGLDLYEDILLPFVVYNKIYQKVQKDNPGVIGSIFLFQEQTINKSSLFKKEVKIQDIWDDREKYNEGF